MAGSFYDDPSIYDILHAAGTAAEVDGLEQIERRFAPAGGSGASGPGRAGAWLEPACGTARYLRVAAMRGRRVVGFDTSEAMIEYARARLERLGSQISRRATLFVADMETFDAAPALSGRRPPRMTFAFNLINTFRHLETEAAALAHLRAMRRILAPGAVYALGVSLSGYGNEFPSEDVWEARRGRVRVRQVAQYDPPASRRQRYEQVHNVVVVQRPNRDDEVQTSSYRLRTYDRAQLEALVEQAGFKLAGHVDEAGRDIPIVEPGYGTWILRA
jgi:SAM-dependent methyltransferase